MWYEYGMRARYLRLNSKKAQELSALKKEAERDGAFRVAKRIHAVLLNHQRHSSGEIANILEAAARGLAIAQRLSVAGESVTNGASAVRGNGELKHAVLPAARGNGSAPEE